MPRTRRLRLLTVLLMLGALLWAQGALAGYLCPSEIQAIEKARMVQDGMPCAELMAGPIADEPASLCHAHCQSDHASAESYQPPALATVAQLGAVLTLDGPAEAPRPTGFEGPPLLRREGAPPLTISHCCFRL